MNSLIKPQRKGVISNDESLANYTTWRVGGRTARLFKPANLIDLAQFLASVPDDEPLLWLGLGSNTLIRDGGFAGTTLFTLGGLSEMSLLSSGKVRVEAGVSCASMARFCARNNLAGGEFWAGIPGTMGGALRMNAGCFDGETWDKVVELEVMDRRGNIEVVSPDDFNVSYRHVEGLGERWFVAASFQLMSGDKLTSLNKIKQLLARRAKTQPTGEFTCGSVFRNPEGDYAAHLIESCGLKGMRMGHAVVSDKHANFILNQEGLASASEIESLIMLVHDTVLTEKGIDLEREVHIVGDYTP